MEHSPGLERPDGQVVLNEVVSLNAVLDKVVVALDQVTNVVLNSQVVNSVDSDDSGHRIMNCIASSIGVRDISIHVEVNTVSAYDSWLSAVSELGVSNMTLKSILRTTCHQEM